MADYLKLVQETESIDLRSISPCALDELLLVKRAISFFETLKRINHCLRQGVARSVPGQMDTQQLSLYQLTSALASVDPKTCSDPIKFFLTNALAIRNLRAAMKGGRWGTEEVAELMIRCAAHTEKQKKESNMPWFDQIETQNIATLDRLGIGLEHVGHNVRKLDYGREILGGSWSKKSTSEQQSEMYENDFDFSPVEESAHGLSSLLMGKVTKMNRFGGGMVFESQYMFACSLST